MCTRTHKTREKETANVQTVQFAMATHRAQRKTSCTCAFVGTVPSEPFANSEMCCEAQLVVVHFSFDVCGSTECIGVDAAFEL